MTRGLRQQPDIIGIIDESIPSFHLPYAGRRIRPPGTLPYTADCLCSSFGNQPTLWKQGRSAKRADLPRLRPVTRCVAQPDNVRSTEVNTVSCRAWCAECLPAGLLDGRRPLVECYDHRINRGVGEGDRLGARRAGGKSEPGRAKWLVTPTRREPRESATEKTRPTSPGECPATGKGEMVR